MTYTHWLIDEAARGEAVSETAVGYPGHMAQLVDPLVFE